MIDRTNRTRHRKQKDQYSRRKQPHALKRVTQRTIMRFEDIRRAVTSRTATLVGKARYNRDLYEVRQPNNTYIYVVWDAKHWVIRTVLTRAMVERGRHVSLSQPLAQQFVGEPIHNQIAA